MDNYLEELWQKTLRLIRNEITDVSFDTWIKAIEPVSIKGDQLYLCVPMTLPKAYWKDATPV
jgi:chromosomal replication initiator protein